LYLYYRATDLTTLLKIRSHFLQFSLQSSKLVYFQMWSQVLDRIVAKEHLTLKGLYKIVSIKSHFPRGSNNSLFNAFPDIPSFTKPPFISFTLSLDPHWLAGFVNGDGFFGLGYIESDRYTLGATCQPSFRVTQHS
jgi:hypothetical protein